ncbi:helix-turn-helix transcriptional regulator [Terricaulis silvestris]|uniref:Bacillibactin transport regulator n=1 Tax=Terricaulis silvestris TaxID=2686094 RepID=A0A6I6MG58_9CAUL|nr:helix-turn-helix transcriptional regulator [Terricaulis silvestris]QGZ93219.1 Bacillibactin transport regulator [Terricaulis silvestris]
MSVHETTHARGDRIAPHRHELGYAALVLEGAYEELSADGVWRVEAGDLIVHPAFHLHLNRFETRGARVLNITLPHALARALDARRYGILRARDPDRLARRATKNSADAVGEALAEAAARSPVPARDWLDRLASDLSAQPQRRINSLARRHGVSAEHVSRAFARRFGMTPARFRAEQRLQTALQALTESALSLAQIAVQAGYADQAHFSRAIAAATDMPPARLRAALA